MAEQKLQVAPTILELEADAGETLTERISVTAPEDALVVELQHADFGFDDESYELRLIRDDADETTAFSTRGWFSLPRPRHRVASGQTLDLELRIEVPENTPAGTYLGAALIRVVPEDVEPGASQVQAVAETGPLVFISVEGGAPPRAAVREFELPRFVRNGPLRPDIVVENRGDEFFTFEGTITLSGPDTDDEVEIRRQFVVPGQPRRVRLSPDLVDEAGRVELGTDELGFGRYEVHTRLRIEPTGSTLTASRTVWVVPPWAWGVAVLAALVFAVCTAIVIAWLVARRRTAAEQGSEYVADDEELSLDDAALLEEEALVEEDDWDEDSPLS